MIRICRWLLCCSIFVSCTKEPVYIETVNVSENPYLINLDTFSVNATVFRLDSFETGNTGIVVAGVHNDPLVGTTSAKTYLHFKLPVADYNNVGNQNEYFDSIVFVAKINTTFLGDTTVPFRLNVHRLEQEIYNEDNLFYNVSSFSEETGSLGVFNRSMRPLLGDSVRVKLKDDLGSELFRYYKEKNEIIRTDEAFQRWFRGIKLVPEGNGPLYAFPTADSNIYIRLYYHTDVAVRESKYLQFALSGAGKDFSEIATNTAGTAFASVTPGSSVKAEQIGNQYLFFPLAGIRTGFSFPTIKTIPGYGDFVRLMASQLQLYPNSGTYRDYTIPDTLNAYFRLPDLSYEGPLATLDGTASQTGSLVRDDLYGINTFYTWDVPAYISTEMTSNNYTERAFVPLSGNYKGTLQGKWNHRLLGTVESGKKTKLSVQLLVYQSNN
ncbi:MAG: DUF4270 family protein [Chitinophagaceae bacterium]